jgi:glyoxylase-like metal-dependent hydrolase (beta-lactamase superfamily II)
MMQRERIADNVYAFQSEVYAQVTAGAVIGPNWAVVIDTLALPDETIAMREYIEQDIGVPVRYVIDTHSHADHAWGNCFFPGATVISHSLCRKLLDGKGRQAMEQAKKQNPAFRNARVVLPQLTFSDGSLNLRAGKKTLSIFPLPGHCADNIAVLVEEDRVLFAGDAAMPLPYIVDGDIEALSNSLKKMAKMSLENVVQGHGDIILRGEIDEFLHNNLAYLSNIRKVVRKANKRKYPLDILEDATVESCGKSRVLLGGLASELHIRNLKALYKQIYGVVPLASDDEFYDDDEEEEDED